MDTEASQMDSLWIYIFCMGGSLFSLVQNNSQTPPPAQKSANIPCVPPTKKPQNPHLDPNGPNESYMKKLFFLPLRELLTLSLPEELGLFWLHGRHLGKLLKTCVKYSYHAHSWSLGILSKTCLAIDCCFEESVQQQFLSFLLWHGIARGITAILNNAMPLCYSVAELVSVWKWLTGSKVLSF